MVNSTSGSSETWLCFRFVVISTTSCWILKRVLPYTIFYDSLEIVGKREKMKDTISDKSPLKSLKQAHENITPKSGKIEAYRWHNVQVR